MYKCLIVRLDLNFQKIHRNWIDAPHLFDVVVDCQSSFTSQKSLFPLSNDCIRFMQIESKFVSFKAHLVAK